MTLAANRLKPNLRTPAALLRPGLTFSGIATGIKVLYLGTTRILFSWRSSSIQPARYSLRGGSGFGELAAEVGV